MDSLKPVAFLLLITCLRPSVSLYSQSIRPTVTLNESGSPLEKVLREIQRQTGFSYFLDEKLSGKARRVSIAVTDASIVDVLTMIFRDQPLSYEIVDGNFIAIQERKDNSVPIRGRVTNDKDEPIPGATILSRGMKGERSVSTMTNDHGEFVIYVSPGDTALDFSSVNYEVRRLRILRGGRMQVQLKARVSELVNVNVTAPINTGYQRISIERSTGSFVTLDRDLLGREVQTNILDRLEGITSGLLFNKNIVTGTNQSPFTIRGRSTILANADPVIVIDNFPYNGDIQNLNPDDVESITVLRDAAAASIWGAFSGNGVVVITTRKGHYDQKTKFGFNTSANWGAKPNVFYEKILSSPDYVNMEKMLFDSGFFSMYEQNSLYPRLSPVVETLIKLREGGLSQPGADAQLAAYQKIDVRKEISRYYYRHSLNNQYAVNLSGGSARNSFYLSGGYDRNNTNLVRNNYDRVTVNGNNVYALIPKKLELTTGMFYTYSKSSNNNLRDIGVTYPYAQLKGADGQSLALPAYFREGYVDTAGGGKLLDWHYRPLDELNDANNVTKVQDYRLNVGLKYAIWKGLEAQVYYQYGHGETDVRNLYSQQTYFTRDLINRYTQINPDGSVVHGIPLGGILDETLTTYDVNNARVQLGYDHLFKEDHRVNLIAGWELRDVELTKTISRQYGYDDSRQYGTTVDYNVLYPLYNFSVAQSKIPYVDHVSSNSDRYLSYYANGSYTYKGRYTVSGSARKDESNLFGTNANDQHGIPLWSAGVAWDISKEGFYAVKWLPKLKLRVTNGYNGNVDRSVSAYTTVLINTGTNPYGAAVATINNPPNPDLRWERTHIINFGLDFGTKGERIGGSLEYYIKAGRDLIGQVPVDPTTGVSVFTGNTADMVAHGLDLTLRTRNLQGNVRWNTVFLFSYVKDRVTTYKQRPAAILNYTYAYAINPLQGHPLYSVYALRWMGLDPANGDPQGWQIDSVNGHGHVSKDYSGILNSTVLDNLVYKGPASPPLFGSLRNDFFWRQFGLSFNITYKFGYYFRRNSVYYSTLFSGSSKGHPDYDRRWMAPGDEKTTYVPSLVYPANSSRDNFYSNSEPLIEKGDHIRLQDIQVSYEVPKKLYMKAHVQTARFYCYANNVGILWKANHQGIDPDYILTTVMPNPRTIALGLKLEF